MTITTRLVILALGLVVGVGAGFGVASFQNARDDGSDDQIAAEGGADTGDDGVPGDDGADGQVTTTDPTADTTGGEQTTSQPGDGSTASSATEQLARYEVPSDAMAPAVPSGSEVVVDHSAVTPVRGDIILYRTDDQLVIKRVLAVGGDTIQAAGNQLTVNGQVVDEPYLAADTTTDDFGPVLVPDGELFVIGDNRATSLDSRIAGPVPLADVSGTVVEVDLS